MIPTTSERASYTEMRVTCFISLVSVVMTTGITATLANKTVAVLPNVFLPTTLLPGTTARPGTKKPFIPTVLPDITLPQAPGNGTANDEVKPTLPNSPSVSSGIPSKKTASNTLNLNDSERLQTLSNAKTTGFGGEHRESDDKSMNQINIDDITVDDVDCIVDAPEHNTLLENITVFFETNPFLRFKNSPGASNLFILLMNRSEIIENEQEPSSSSNTTSIRTNSTTQSSLVAQPNPTSVNTTHSVSNPLGSMSEIAQPNPASVNTTHSTSNTLGSLSGISQPNPTSVNTTHSATNPTDSTSGIPLPIRRKANPSHSASHPFGSMSRAQCRSSKKKPRKVAPYGSWASPVSSVVAVSARNLIIEPPRVDPVTGHVFWVEQITSEEGHGAVFQYNVETSKVVRWTKSSVDVRTRVHEYGGGSLVPYNDTIYYSDGVNNQLYRQRGVTGAPDQLTNNTQKRYADGSYSPKTNHLFYVCEDSGPVASGEKKTPSNSIVLLDLTTLKETTLLEHADFFAAPRVTEDGKKLAWVEWNHPNMPWDVTKVYVAELKPESLELNYHQLLQHGSMMMPSWNSNRELLYVHDMSGWWNLHIIDRRGRERNLTPQSVEIGWPMWKLGRQAYDTNAAVGAHEAVVIVGKELHVVDTETGNSSLLETGYDTYSLGVAFARHGRKVYTVAGDGKRFPSVVEVDLESGSARPLVALKPPVPENYISTARLVQFPTSEGMFAYGHLYMPKNPEFEAPAGTLPPLLVRTHQGPTLAAVTTLNVNYQFFTSRGIAILDVDYRGSTGYGKFYRNLLDFQWGVYDVEDVVAGANQLVKDGIVNPDQLFIDGESAGGFTCLGAVSSTDIFSAGASLYGISDLQMLVTTSHKFESTYMEKLIGSPAKDHERYNLRSPLQSYINISTPVIFMHGVEDKVVPIEQAELMYNALKGNGIATAFIRFEGEEHDFRSQHTLVEALEAELYFFSRIANFTLADVTSDVVIDNLDSWHARGHQLPTTTATTGAPERST